jgi:hypothetical protein
MVAIMDKMVERSRKVDGADTSLLDLGYANCGLDDNWQSCGDPKAAFGSTDPRHGSFHDIDGNPLINQNTFPSMKNMTSHAHAAGLRVGWYMNNCICDELACKFQPRSAYLHLIATASNNICSPPSLHKLVSWFAVLVGRVLKTSASTWRAR